MSAEVFNAATRIVMGYAAFSPLEQLGAAP